MMQSSKFRFCLLLCLFSVNSVFSELDNFAKCHGEETHNDDIELCQGFRSKIRSTPDSSLYTAGVVEYNPVHEGTQQERFQANLNNYLDFIKEAGEKNVDILVFPEGTLTSINVSLAYPVPFNHGDKEFRSPCSHLDDYHQVLVNISCAAKEHELYVVINMNEQLDCTKPREHKKCPGEGVYAFNTNVVFDRSGNIIDKYRKINLCEEPKTTPSPDNRLGVFDTDFGVRFGHFICFDVLFREPAVRVLHAAHVRDVVFPTMWFSQSPFLTAIQTQAAYAYVNDINFIAAGANNVSLGSSGSGIYSGKSGALVSAIPGVDTRKLLIAKVPKDPGQWSVRAAAVGPDNGDVVEKNAIALLRDGSVAYAVSQLIDMSIEYQTIHFTKRNIECTIDVKLKNLSSPNERVYTYRAVAYDGVWNVAQRHMGMSYCAVMACRNDNMQTCGLRLDNVVVDHTLKFEMLQIHAKVPSETWNWTAAAPSSTHFPTTLQDTLMPLEPEDYHLYSSDDKISKVMDVHMELKNFDSRLLVFGFYRRNFDDDDTGVTDPPKSVLSDEL